MKKWFILLLLIPFIASAQQDGFYNLSATQITLPGPHISYTGSFSAFTTPTGTASASQSIAVSGSSLNSSVLATPGTGFEVSLNNSSFSSSVTLANTGNALTGQPVTVYMRIAAATGVSSGSSNLVLTTPGQGGVGTVTLNVPYTYTVNPNPSMAVSPTSLSGLTSSSGTQGTPATYTLSWTNWLGANIGVVAPTGHVVSQDGTVYNTSTTVTPSGASGNRTMYDALASGNSAGTYAGSIVHTAFGASNSPLNLGTTGVTSAATNTPDTIGYFFDSTTGPIAGMYEIRGNAGGRIISGTVPGTTLTYTSVAANTNNWNNGGLTSTVFANDGVTNATIPVGATKAMYEAWFTSNIYTTSYPQIILGGFKTDGTTYDIVVSGTTSYPVNANTTYNVQGATLQTSQTFLAQSNISNSASWTSLSPDGSGNFTFYIGKVTSSEQYAFVSYITIKKH